MKPLPHEYEVRLHGGPAGYAQLCTEGAPELRAAPAGTDHERVILVVERSKKACLISASLAVPVCLQSNIVEA